MKLIFITILLYQSCIAGDSFYYKNNEKVDIAPYSNQSRSFNSDILYWKNENGVVLGISNLLLVKFITEIDMPKYLSRYNLSIEKNLGEGLYLLKTQGKTYTIDISNRLNEKEDVKFAHPDFIKKRVKR